MVHWTLEGVTIVTSPTSILAFQNLKHPDVRPSQHLHQKSDVSRFVIGKDQHAESAHNKLHVLTHVTNCLV